MIHPSSRCIPVYPTSFHYLHYSIEPCLCIVDCFGSWLALLCLCYCFDIALSIYDLFSVQCGQCACKYTHPIILSLFVCQLSCLRGIDVELVGGKGLIVLYVFLGEGDLCTHTHAHTGACICAAKPVSDVRNCTLICIRIIDTSN